MTHPADRPLPGWLTRVPFAHRGLHGPGAPENSLEAAETAAAAGLGIELDVRMAADGTPVVVHDAHLRRVAGAPILVATTPADELAEVPLDGGDRGVPTLRAVLGTVDGRVPVMLEIKSPGVRVAPLTAAVAAAVRAYTGPACVTAFNPLVVRWLARNAGGILRGQTAGRLARVPLPAPLRGAVRWAWWQRVTRPHFVCFRLAALPSPATDRWRSRGRVLIAWTARSEAHLAAARRRADNVIVEGPAARALVS